MDEAQDATHARLPALATSGLALGQQISPVRRYGHEDMQVKAVELR